MDATEPSRAARGTWLALGVLAALAAAHLAWPGDVGFIYDEPNLMRKALAANKAGTLAKSGLLGSFGVEYGPVVAWFYQALLGLSRDLTFAVLVKAALGWTALVLGLGFVARRARLSPWPILLVVGSPFAWHFVRTLHDIVFLVPLSAVLFVLVAAFLERPRVWLFAAWAAWCALAIHVHVIACVPIAVSAATLVAFRGRWWKEHALAVGGSLFVAFAVSAPFLWRVLFERVPGNHPHPEFLRSAWLGVRSFLLTSHFGFEHYVPAFYAEAAWTRPLALATGVVMLAGGAFGLATFVRAAARAGRGFAAWPLELALAAFAAGLVVAQLALVLVLRLEAYWHYFSGVALGGFYLVWWSIERARFAAVGRAVLVASGVICVVLTAGVARHVHVHGGDRTPVYGATLANQQEVARRIVEERLAEVRPEVQNYALFPVALQVLVELAAGEAGFTPLPNRPPATIAYRDADPASGFIELHVGERGAPSPANPSGAGAR